MTNKQNFEKDINVPSEKPIIIDGVDVSKCTLYGDGRCNNACNPLNCLFCSEKPNCHYKQIARKTQVIDEIEEVIKPYQEQIELDALSLPSAIESILERKTQECEELKEELAIYKKMLDDPEFKIALADVRTGEREVWRELGSKVDRYSKGLEEIEKYCNNQKLKFDTTAYEILDIINQAKGEINDK